MEYSYYFNNLDKFWLDKYSKSIYTYSIEALD